MLQQLVGINAVLFYSSNIFTSAGNQELFSCILVLCQTLTVLMVAYACYAGVTSSNLATLGIGAVQVFA